jgi:hypothetical protein
MAKQLGGAFTDLLQANWMWIVAGLVAVFVVYLFVRSQPVPKVKEKMCGQCPKIQKQNEVSPF